MFTIGGGLSSGLCHVASVAFAGKHLTCFGCILWLKQRLVSVVRNKNKSHCKVNTTTPHFWSACFEILPRGFAHYLADTETHSRDAPIPEYHCWQWGERLAKTRISSQGQWCCLIQLERLGFAHFNKTDILRLICPCGEDCPQDCKAMKSIPDLHSLHVSDSSLPPLMTQNVLHHCSCLLDI